MAPPSRLEIIKRKNEVQKALGWTFQERFKLIVPSEGAFTWIKGDQYNRGVVLQITPHASKPASYIIAELSLDKPFTVTYVLVTITRVPQGSSAYIDEETSREELTIDDIVQHQNDGGELQRPLNSAVTDTANAEQHLSVLVRWFYMSCGLVDVTEGDVKAFALQLRETTKSVGTFDTQKRPERRLRARVVTRPPSPSAEEAGEDSNSRVSQDIRHSGLPGRTRGTFLKLRQPSSVMDEPACSPIVHDLPSSPSISTQTSVEQNTIEQEPFEHIPHTDIPNPAASFRPDSHQPLAVETQEDSAIETFFQASMDTTTSFLPVSKPAGRTGNLFSKRVTQPMPTPTPTPTLTPTPTPTPNGMATSPWPLGPAETPSHSSHAGMPRIVSTIRSSSLWGLESAEYSREGTPAYKSAAYMVTTFGPINIDARITQSILRRTANEEFQRYSQEVVKNITMVKYTYKDYRSLVIRMEDGGLHKEIFACLTNDWPNGQVDIFFKDRDEGYKKVEISMPKRVQKGLGRPFSQAISWDAHIDGQQDGGDRVRLFCKYVFAAKGYIPWSAFKNEDIEEVIHMLAFMRDREPNFARPIEADSHGADEDADTLLPPISAGTIGRRKRKERPEKRELPAFEPLGKSLIPSSQRRFKSSVIASVTPIEISRPTNSPTARAQGRHAMQAARQADLRSEKVSKNAMGFVGAHEVQTSRGVLNVNDKRSTLFAAGAPNLNGSGRADTDATTLRALNRSAGELELQDSARRRPQGHRAQPR